MLRLWTRFFREDAPADLYTQLTDYLNHTGEFSEMRQHCSILKVTSEGEVSL